MKIQNVLKDWANRSLSLFGKITMINSLIASLLVYKMQVLPNMPDSYIRKIEHLIIDFLWNGKKAKIALKILQANKNIGGIRLVNLRKKEMSLKIAWIRILEFDHKMSVLAYHFIQPIMESDIWYCNLNARDVLATISLKNKFWQHVVLAWSNVNFQLEPLIRQTLWYNSNIRIQNKVIFWPKAYKRGLLWISQILTTENKLISNDEAKDLFGISFIELLSLYNAYMAAPVFQTNEENNLNRYEKLLLCKNVSRSIYTELCDVSGLLNDKANAWAAELEIVFTTNDLVIALRTTYSVTNAPKYRSFQYRLLQRAIITNVHLARWGKISSNMCTFCCKEKESYIHLFFLCEKIQSVWHQIIEFMSSFNDTKVILNARNVICNSIAPKYNVKNFLCLIFKQYIYRQRCFVKDLSFHEYKVLVYQICNIEKYTAMKNNRYSFHVKKWSQPNPHEFITDYFENM